LPFTVPSPSPIRPSIPPTAFLHIPLSHPLRLHAHSPLTPYPSFSPYRFLFPISPSNPYNPPTLSLSLSLSISLTLFPLSPHPLSLLRHAGELDSCQQQCQRIISADSSNEQATIMLSEVLFMAPEPDIEAAVRPLQQLLRDHPNNYRGE
jgi:hypothetical protein